MAPNLDEKMVSLTLGPAKGIACPTPIGEGGEGGSFILLKRNQPIPHPHRGGEGNGELAEGNDRFLSASSDILKK